MPRNVHGASTGSPSAQAVALAQVFATGWQNWLPRPWGAASIAGWGELLVRGQEAKLPLDWKTLDNKYFRQLGLEECPMFSRRVVTS